MFLLFIPRINSTPPLSFLCLNEGLGTRCRLEEVNNRLKTVKVKVPDWYPGYAVLPYYAYPYYYPWYGYYVWPY
jgi:hypothetical protein